MKRTQTLQAMEQFNTYQQAVDHIKRTAGINGLSEELAVIIESGTDNTYFVYWDIDKLF